MKNKDIIDDIILIPRRFNESGDVSVFALLQKAHYYDFHNEVSEEVIKSALLLHPECADEWIQFSSNKRGGSGWFIVKDDFDKFIVGNLYAKDATQTREYSDKFLACAAFVKREIEGVRDPDALRVIERDRTTSNLSRVRLYRAKFLRNLTGEREDKFKKAFILRFREDLSIKCAYLVEVEKDDGSKAAALCLKAPYADQNAVTAGVKEVYSQFYGPEDHLDIIFLTPRQEIEMEGQCMPFYDIQDEAHRLVTNGKPGLLSTMTARVAESCLGDKPFLEAARREPTGPTDSGWTFYSHSGAQDDPAKTETWTLLQVFRKDPSFLRWVDAPIGTALWRTDARFEWRDLAEKPQTGQFRLPPADGPGPFAANEPPKRFGDGNNREDAKPGGGSHPPDDAPLRTYLDLNPRREPPADLNLYYECLACGGILPSVTSAEQKCLCGNVTSKNGHILIKNFAKARLFRQE